jgi:FtsP/CotA-like multicopper oxidase with cupredoxin domain
MAGGSSVQGDPAAAVGVVDGDPGERSLRSAAAREGGDETDAESRADQGRDGALLVDFADADTISLRPGEAVEIITRFGGYRGRYLFHCHNAEHEDMGMMVEII